MPQQGSLHVRPARRAGGPGTAAPTAAQTLIGREIRVTASHGELLPSPLARFVTATVHPSSLLRAPDEEQRREGLRRFIADLARAAAAVR